MAHGGCAMCDDTLASATHTFSAVITTGGWRSTSGAEPVIADKGNCLLVLCGQRWDACPP